MAIYLISHKGCLYAPQNLAPIEEASLALRNLHAPSFTHLTASLHERTYTLSFYTLQGKRISLTINDIDSHSSHLTRICLNLLPIEKPTPLFITSSIRRHTAQAIRHSRLLNRL